MAASGALEIKVAIAISKKYAIYFSGIALLIYSSVSNDTALPKHLPDPSVFIDLEKTVGSTNGRLLTHHAHPSINIEHATSTMTLFCSLTIRLSYTANINLLRSKIILKDQSETFHLNFYFFNVIS